MRTKEGFYCRQCFAYHGPTGSDLDQCVNCDEHALEYHTLHSCSQCGETEITAQGDWTCGNLCGQED